MGFKTLMSISWIDAMYMTVITMTTVGYREVQAPTVETKVFIIFLIIFSVIIVGYAVAVVTEYLLTRTTLKNVKEKRLLKKIKSMENHVIVVGYGRNGKQAVQKLRDYHKDFIVIERDQEVIDNAQLDEEFFLKGNAIEDEVLIKAGIEKASNLIAALPKDADNLFVVLSARQLNAKLGIISRASEETSYKKLKLAGANNVILPDSIGGQHMASLVVNPDLLEFWDNLSYGGNQGVNLEQLSFEQMFDDNHTCTIKELRKMSKTGCTIIGYKSPDGEYVVNPSPEIELTAGSKIIVVGNTSQIKNMQKAFKIND
jgi:voltage-gated potassium channel